MGTNQQKEAELVRLAKLGNEEAFTEIVNIYSDRLYTLLVRMLRDSHEAEDALQETFITMIEKIGSFKGQSQLYTWLYRIASNIALMKLRSRTGKMSTTIDEAALPEKVHGSNFLTVPDNPEERINNKELKEILNWAIGMLPPNYRSVFVLRDEEQLSVRETAGILGISKDNVKTRLRRARMTLRDLLAEKIS